MRLLIGGGASAPSDRPTRGAFVGTSTHWRSPIPDLNDAEVGTMKVVIGVATAATHDPVLAAALDELVLSQPRRMIGVVLDNAVARGEIPAGHDLALIGDAALGLNILRAITGRPIDRVFIRRVLEDLILPLATAPADNNALARSRFAAHNRPARN